MVRHAAVAAVYMYLVCILLVIQAPVSTAAPNIAPALEQIQPLVKGDKAPAFTVYRADGTPFRFDPDKLETTTLIVFYRGGWCGACNQQLRDLAEVVPDIKEMGADVLFINGDRPEILYTSLRPDTSREDWHLAGSSIDRYDALPLPSIFIINPDGGIAFDFYNMDPTVRLPAEGVRAAVEEAMSNLPRAR